MNYEKLFKFYKNLQADLKTNGIKFRLIGGQAAIEHQIAEFTKDCDLNIESSSAEKFCVCLDNLSQKSYKVNYRFGFGAPLDLSWGEHGWTSHLEIISQDIKARLDIFMKLPRVSPTVGFQAGVSELDILAETKKTQRDKDWDFVNLLGSLMLKQGNSRGLLHIFKKDILIDFHKTQTLNPEQFFLLRPNLKLIVASPDKLEIALMIERLFWQKWDHQRIQLFMDSSAEYLARIKNLKVDLQKETFRNQHNEIRVHAEQCLVKNPFTAKPVSIIVSAIVEELRQMFEFQIEKYLPNLEQIVHKDGVYNPY